ncbi:hypothetical protein DXT63_08520 [Thermoanaerobacteraceae bacterium SP2]|nr:hypothetical protein DXT63_08520 [Thermoanaerobacteraceae bacterium SP2]
MARYNWEKLKQKFLLGDYKSLREFAEREGLKYNGNFIKKTKGWGKEKDIMEAQKRCKIVERVTERQIKQEVDWNTTHLKLWGEFLNILRKALKDGSIEYKDGRINAYTFEKFANVMEKVQKGQRLALGLDEKQEQNDDSIDALIEAIQRSREEL